VPPFVSLAYVYELLKLRFGSDAEDFLSRAEQEKEMRLERQILCYKTRSARVAGKEWPCAGRR
jgi:hypothetical protein